MKPQLTDLGYDVNVYIKTHNKTGMRYFGKTVNTDVENYTGSGTYWKEHIKEHGYNCRTIVVLTSRLKEELEAFCHSFSEHMDISNSKDWANMVPESGLGGHDKGYIHSAEAIAKMKAKRKLQVITPEARLNMSKAHKGKVLSEEHKKNIGGTLPWNSGNSQRKHIQHLWSLLPAVYDWLQNKSRPNYGSGGRAAAAHFGLEYSMTWNTIVGLSKKFPDGSFYGSKEYADWKEKFKLYKPCTDTLELKEKAYERPKTHRVYYIGTNMETGETIGPLTSYDFKKLGFTASNVSNCVNGKQSHHKGFTWVISETTNMKDNLK